MSSIFVHLASQDGHWRIGFNIDGQVQPREIFACRSGLDPLLRGLRAAEAEYDRIRARPQDHPEGLQSAVTVRMPSGRVLAFTLAAVQEMEAEVPQPLSAAPLRGGGG